MVQKVTENSKNSDPDENFEYETDSKQEDDVNHDERYNMLPSGE